VIVRPKSSLILVGLLVVLLPLLGFLQYRWIDEVSAAERDRLESGLRVASDRFASDFDAELSRLANHFQMRGGFPESGDTLAERYMAWSEANAYPRLVRAIYLIKLSPDEKLEFYNVNLAARDLEPAALPKELELENARGRFRPGLVSTEAGNRMLLVTAIFRGGRSGSRSGDFPPRRPEEFRGREGRPGRELGPERGPSGPGPGGPGGPVEGEVVIELDRDVIVKELLPALAEKNFSSRDETAYRIAVVRSGSPHVLYSSAGEWKPEDIAQPDAVVELFGAPRPAGFGGRRGGGGPRGLFQGALVSEPWQLVVQHRAGSVERAVAEIRMRNLAIGFGILLVLGASLIVVVVSSQRAHTLGKLQMEFAAGVSHELRTPLAVIRSAAHNLRSGVVRDKEGVEEYAAIVQQEARRLSDMVEEVLLYAETQSSRKKYSVEPIDVTEVIDRAITNLSPTIDPEHCEVITRIDPDLPPAKADAAALTQCVQNLLSNAIKYGKTGDKTQIEIDASNDPNAKEIRLIVTDHGQGIDAADHRQLFEPFYRGASIGSNVPGNGLGLHLVKRMMQAQGGRVTFTTADHGGASFTLHIPAES